MNYQEAIKYLFQLQKFGARLGLEKSFQLAEWAGRPQDQLRFIHVAGTNGKGSTCAMLESIYRRAGYTTGLYTSPHLLSFAERIQVNRTLIPEGDVARLTSRVKELIAQFPDQQATFFEAVTVMAMLYFVEQKCDVVIWETGLGGRLDSTNIVTPLASIITNIQHDHEKWLGHTLPEIAREKAGIIKLGVPVLTATEDEGAFAVIEAIARDKNAPLTRVGTLRDENIRVPLLGAHQLKNAALAIETVNALSRALPCSAEAIREGIAAARWAGRFDRRGRFILDGAHNPEGAEALRATIQQEFSGKRPAFIIGVLADKDYNAMFREFAKVAGRVVTVSVLSERAADAEVLAKRFSEIAPNIPVRAANSLAEAIAATEGQELTVITGSLHFIGEAMETLKLEPGASGERGLNDWKADLTTQ